MSFAIEFTEQLVVYRVVGSGPIPDAESLPIPLMRAQVHGKMISLVELALGLMLPSVASVELGNVWDVIFQFCCALALCTAAKTFRIEHGSTFESPHTADQLALLGLFA